MAARRREPVRPPRERKPSATALSRQAGLIEPLTEREIEVLSCVALGRSNKEVAQELTLAVNTVKKHLRNIYGKLGVRSRTSAVAQARSLGLLQSNGRNSLLATG